MIHHRPRPAGVEPAPDVHPAPVPRPHAVAALEADSPELSTVRWLEQLRTDLAESVGGVVLRGARAVPIGTGLSTRPTSSAGRLAGWNLRETTGAAGAVVRLWNGRELGAAVLLATIGLPSGATDTHHFPGGGINVDDQGVIVELVSGSVEGVIFLGGVS